MQRSSVLRLLVGILALAVFTVLAQTPVAPPPNQVRTQALPPQQLDNLVAPIALYPDPLLSQVLAAATYPVELVEAQQWLEANSNLSGRQLMDAARQQNWDASVQALVAMPQVLALLTQDVRWTTDLGNAFLAQQGDIMSAVQRMRERAQANGQLRSSPQETVTTEDQGGQQAIDIQPADPNQIYVPAYDPYYVYGYGSYPPLYYPDGYWFEPGINIGLYFGGWGGWGFGGWGWGWGLNWFGRGIFVNNAFFNRYGFHNGYGLAGGIGGRTAWAHDPAHRQGATYAGAAVSSRFGAASQASRIAAGRAGNWHTFGEGNIGSERSAFAGAARQAPAARGFQGGQSSPSYRAQGYQGQAQRPAPSFQQAPQRSFQSASPHVSAPSFGGGGGSRSFSSGGSSHNSGGHGGGRR